MATPDAIRSVIAKQTTVSGSIHALLTAVTNDPTGLAAAIEGDPQAWSDAVLANTPLAVETATPITGVGADTEEAFAPHKPKETPKAQHQDKR